MKNNKVTKWIFSLLTFLPMLAVGVMSLYTIFNKNAKDSYSSYVDSDIHYVNNNDLVMSGELLTITYNGKTTNDTRTYDILDNETNIQELFFDNENWQAQTINILVSGGAGGQSRLYVIDTNNNSHSILNWQTISNTFYFRNGSDFTSSNIESYYYNVSYTTFVKGTLDNAFEYSMSKFNDLGFDKVDFVGLFNDIFNSQYNVYTTFINCYLNYMLFVTLVTFVPRVLYWFINWSFGLVDKFTERGGM